MLADRAAATEGFGMTFEEGLRREAEAGLPTLRPPSRAPGASLAAKAAAAPAAASNRRRSAVSSGFGVLTYPHPCVLALLAS